MIRCHRSTPNPISFQSTFLCYHLGYVVIVTGHLLPSSSGQMTTFDSKQIMKMFRHRHGIFTATTYVHGFFVFEMEMISGLFSAQPKSLEYHIIFLQNNLSLMLQWAPSAVVVERSGLNGCRASPSHTGLPWSTTWMSP